MQWQWRWVDDDWSELILIDLIYRVFLVDLIFFALLALASSAIVLADARPAARFALASLPVVLADA
jgi:hypothetical protein